MTNTSPVSSPPIQPPKKRKRPTREDGVAEKTKKPEVDRPGKSTDIKQSSQHISTTPPFSPVMYHSSYPGGPQHVYSSASVPLPPPLMQIHPHMLPVMPGSTAYYHPGLSPQLYPNYGAQRYSTSPAVVATSQPHGNAALSPAGARYNNILPKKDGETDSKDSKNQAIQPKSTTMPPPSPNVTYTQHPSMYHAGHQYVQISPQLPPNMVPMTPPSSVYMQADLSPSLGPSMDLDRSRRISTTSSTSSTADQREQARKESHSAIERRRRERINDKILQLKQLIPSCADQDHLHKMSILQSAIDYIAYLKDIIEKQGGKDLLHGKLSIKTVRSMLPKEVEAFTGQFSVKGRASVGSVDSFSSSPAWSSKQPLEYVQQMELGPPIRTDQPTEENSDSQSETESTASSPNANTPPNKEQKPELTAAVSASPGKLSDDGYDTATPLKPSDLMKTQHVPPRSANSLSNDELGSRDVSKASGVSDTEQDTTVSEKCAQALSQNESSMSVSQMLC